MLIVCVYDRAESLLVATLMHGSLTASTIFIFTPEAWHLADRLVAGCAGTFVADGIWWEGEGIVTPGQVDLRELQLLAIRGGPDGLSTRCPRTIE